ncbi:unnamed protein product [Hermetia illucens]|uniref:Uncharacterized protein n=2 Tax=Hermetia illucens TaxID=343691 RepID=A0A7R8V089_HERIL|nr:unnamed protein product [Hermetia illucens]
MKTPQKKCLFPVRPNNIQSKTPAPLKRVFSNGMDGPLSAIKKPFHSNTFCTPSKIKKIDGKPLNQTDFGLTPKEKTRFESVERKCNAVSTQNHNESIESRSSILSMNVSTSTLLDAPIAPVANSYSPIVRRCVKEIETTLGTKLEKFMDIMKEMHTIRIESSSELKQENHSCMPNINGVSLYSNNNATQQHHSDGTVLDDIHHETQPFAQSSPIFKKPESVKQPRAAKSTLNEVSRPNNTFIDQTSDSTLFQTTQFGNSTVANVTVVPGPRRVSNTMFSGKDETNRPVRRSMRLEQRNSTIIATDEMKVNNRLSLSINRPKERRDSVRRSMRIQKRESIMPIEEIEEKPDVPQKRISKTVPSHNKTIAGYFKTKHENNKPKTKKQAKDAQQKHEKAVLDLLNTGTIREIQILPQVGLKTAYQIITQRTLNGKFRNFDQVSKLPVWRGKAWQRFKVANCIS